MSSDLLPLLDELDRLHGATRGGPWGIDNAFAPAIDEAYPRLSAALRAVLTPGADRLPHVREPDKQDPDVCVHCREAWTDIDPASECSVRLRGALNAERAEHALLVASLTVPERYVGVVSEAVAEEIERLRALVRA